MILVCFYECHNTMFIQIDDHALIDASTPSIIKLLTGKMGEIGDFSIKNSQCAAIRLNTVAMM